MFRRVVAVVLTASVFFFSPTVIPGSIAAVGPVGCGSGGIGGAWLPTDTAYAAPAPIIPCPVSTTTPWAVIGIGLSAFSVILNAIYVSQTQCRELTLQEAWTSAGLPFIGAAFNKKASKCP